MECNIKRELFHSTLITRYHSAVNVGQSVVFTQAENKILERILQGYTGVEMSAQLFRSQKTISSHKRSIMQKLGVHDDVALKKK